MARPRFDEGVGGWIRQSWRALLAEVISTALLVWLGCATLVIPGNGGLTPPALAFAFVVIANIVAFGEVSGAHMNPSVTLAAVIYGCMKPVLAIGYVIAQLLGAVIGFGGLLATTPTNYQNHKVAVTLPSEHVTSTAAVAVEAVITGMLVLTVCGVWAAHNPAKPDITAPIKIGLVVGGLVYAGGDWTGASLNPARSFAPALLQNKWDNHWVYWVGPLMGAAIAALLHRYVISPRPTVQPVREVDLPLNDKP